MHTDQRPNDRVRIYPYVVRQEDKRKQALCDWTNQRLQSRLKVRCYRKVCWLESKINQCRHDPGRRDDQYHEPSRGKSNGLARHQPSG